MAAIAISIIVLALVLAGVVSVATAARRRGPRCACFEFPGDNVYCPIPEHRAATCLDKRLKKWGRRA